jgi:hypothetical protein
LVVLAASPAAQLARERIMSQPATYNRSYNFAEYQALNPSKPLSGNQVGLELNTVEITLDQALANLKVISPAGTNSYSVGGAGAAGAHRGYRALWKLSGARRR